MLQQAGQVPQMAQAQPNPQAMEQARMSGLGAAGGNAFNGQSFAGGGIIAFDKGGDVVGNDVTAKEYQEKLQQLLAILKNSQCLLG